MSRRFSLFGACLLCLLLSACGGKSTRPDVVQPDVPEAVRVTPLETPGVFPVSEAEAQRLSRGLAPARQGMRSWKDMRFAVEQSLAYVRAKPSSRVAVNYPALQVTYGEMEKGLERLLRLLPFLDKAPEVLASDFRWVRIGPDFGFTGYYEPEIPASHVRKGRFQYPIYKSPPDLRKKRPYHTRHAIDCKIRWTSSCSRFRGLDGCVLRTGRCALCCTTGRTGTSMWRLAGSWSIGGC